MAASGEPGRNGAGLRGAQQNAPRRPKTPPVTQPAETELTMSCRPRCWKRGGEREGFEGKVCETKERESSFSLARASSAAVQ